MLILFVNYLITLYNGLYGVDNMAVYTKYKVIDYVTPKEVCKIIGISEKSIAQITRWMNERRIPEVYLFGKNKAIPVTWVKSECLSRGIKWEGVELKKGEIGVSLKDYIPIKEYCKINNLNYNAFNNRIARGYYEDEFIRYANTYGLPR